MLYERDEVSVTEQQRNSILDAKGGDNDISCFSYSYALFSKNSVIFGTLQRHAVPKHLILVQGFKSGFCFSKIPVIFEALEYLEKY